MFSGLLVGVALLLALILWRLGFAASPTPLLGLVLGLVSMLALGLWRLDVAWHRQDQAETQLRRLNADLEARIAERTTELNTHLRALTQANTALIDSHEALRHILNTSLDGFWQVDAEGRLVDVNPMYCTQSGYGRDELLHMHVSDLEAKEVPADTARHLKNLQDKGYERFETQHRRKDGSRNSRWLARMARRSPSPGKSSLRPPPKPAK